MVRLQQMALVVHHRINAYSEPPQLRGDANLRGRVGHDPTLTLVAHQRIRLNCSVPPAPGR